MSTIRYASQDTIDTIYYLLGSAVEALRDANVPFTCIGGTLLGAIRHRGLIPWDDDADLAIPNDAHAKAVIALAAVPGTSVAFDSWGSFKLSMTDGKKIRDGLDFTFPFLDVFPMSLTDSKYQFTYLPSRETWPQAYLDADCFDHIRWLSFGPLSVPVPSQNQADAYLNRAFGSDWPTVRYATYDHENYVDREHEREPIPAGNLSPALPSLDSAVASTATAVMRAELFVRDVSESALFYKRLGFHVSQTAGQTAYTTVQRGTVRLGLCHTTEKVDPTLRSVPTGTELVIEVADVDAEYSTLIRRGITITDPLRDRPWGLRDFRIIDPDGYYLRLTSTGTNREH